MQSNPILLFLKTAAFLALAFLVWLTWWAGSREERKVQKIELQLSQLQSDLAASSAAQREHREAVLGLSGRVEALTDLLASGAFSGPSAGAPGSGGAAAPAEPRRVGRATGDAWRDGKVTQQPPEHLSKAARELWGQRTLYLEDDPDEVEMPSLSTAGLDPAGRLNRWFGSTPSGINPITTSDTLVDIRIEEYCLRYVAQRHVKNPSKYKPQLAVRVEVNKPDYTEWVVWLRDDIWWHPAQVDLNRYPHLKGKHRLTAHDVKFTVDMILNKDVDASHLRNYYSECSGVEVVDDFCYIMRWNKPQYNSIAFTLNVEPLPEFVLAYDEQGTRYEPEQIGLAFHKHWFYEAGHFMGCGPYYVAEYNPSTHLLLRRFDDYYGKPVPIYEVYMEIFPSSEMATKKCESKEHDFTQLTMKEYEKKVRMEKGQNPFSDGRMAEYWSWGVAYSFIAWKNTHPIFKDARVREAMTYACNRPRMRDDLELGEARLATGPHHVNTPFCPPDMQPTPFDLDRARAILAEVGWTDSDGDGLLDKDLDGVRTKFRFQAMVPNNQLFIPIFEIFKEDLKKIGVHMDLDLLEWKQFKERLDARTFECTALLWSGDGWESDLYQIWHSSMADEVPSSNFIEFRDPVADDLIVKLRSTFDLDERLRMQREVHRRIGEQHPYTFLMFYRLPLFYWKDRLGNFDAGCLYIDRPNVRTYPMFIRAR